MRRVPALAALLAASAIAGACHEREGRPVAPCTHFNLIAQVRNDNVDKVCTLASPFSVNGFAGYSSCAGTGGEDGDGCQPVSCPPAGIGSCCSGRPSCSAALNGSATARYFVQCQP